MIKTSQHYYLTYLNILRSSYCSLFSTGAKNGGTQSPQVVVILGLFSDSSALCDVKRFDIRCNSEKFCCMDTKINVMK